MNEFNQKEATLTTKLTDEQIKMISNTLEEEFDKSKSSKIYKDIDNGNMDVPNQGEYKKVMVRIDPKTGEKVITNEDVDDKDFNRSKSEYLQDLANSYSDKENQEIEIDTELSDEETLQIIDVVKKVKDGENINIYKELPETAKQIVDIRAKRMGACDQSVRSKRIKNFVARALIDHYIEELEHQSYLNGPNKQIEDLWKSLIQETSDFIVEYENSKKEIIEELIKNAPEDYKNKEKLEATLDSMSDAYKLNRLKNTASKIKIKKFDFEKPQKVFNIIELKYQNSNRYNIMSLVSCHQILSRHLKNEEDSLRFLLIFSKFCSNYDPKNPDMHSFMYGLTRNITLLDIYKGDQYDKFATEFLENIKEVIDLNLHK